MPFHRLLLIGCLMGLPSQASAEPIRIVAAAASPVHATEVLAVLNQPVDSATVESQLVFFLDDRDRQIEAQSDADYPHLVLVRFSSSRLQPDSIHYLNLGLRKSAQSVRFDRFTQSPPFTVFSISSEAERILAAQFPDGSIPLHYRSGADPVETAMQDLPEEGLDLDNYLGNIEKFILLKALDRTGGIRKRAAELLGISFRSIRYRLAKYGLEVGEEE